MEEFKIHRINGFTINRIIKKTEEYINEIYARGAYDLVSVSFLHDCAIVTWKLK